MRLELLLISAFSTGLLGSIHCIGMCGGIVGALTMNLPPALRASPLRMLPYLLGYNLGRIASYAMAGALVGFASGVLIGQFEKPWIGRGIGALFMIALGLYLGGWWRGLAVTERMGAVLWKRIEPLGRRFLPAHSPVHALGLGAVWGWLPCGLVYAALAGAVAAGGAAQGALVMLAFGLGTLPTLIVVGVAARSILNWVRRPWVRNAMAATIIAFGVYQLLAPGSHGRAHQPGAPAHQHVNAGAPAAMTTLWRASSE